jgi:hypothetical protein
MIDAETVMAMRAALMREGIAETVDAHDLQPEASLLALKAAMVADAATSDETM